jgi:hypothetical protein
MLIRERYSIMPLDAYTDAEYADDEPEPEPEDD